MNVKDFDYYLPEELIAQTPLENREMSRLMVVDKTNGNIQNSFFYNITSHLKAGDVLILNNSKVIPARIFGSRKDSGGAIEVLLLKQQSGDIWEALVKPGRKAKIGQIIEFSEQLTGEVVDIIEDGKRLIKFTYDGNNIFEILDKIGNMPLPPYIKEKLEDKNRYQTVYAKHLGSAAAPTAGLHFTDKLLNALEDSGVIIKYVTLHVGLGTFRPVKVDDITEHIMHSEYFFVPDDTAKAVKEAKKDGRRIVCVGTTSVRTVESAFDKFGNLIKQSGDTSIFIYPGYEFKIPDAIVTNFHLPQSTLIMLISAFAGRENVLNAYKTAVLEKYRFFSFGDAMLIE